MLSSILRDIVGMLELEKEVDDIDGEVSSLKERIQQLENDKAQKERLESLEQRVRDLEPVTVNLTNRERQVLEIFFNKSGTWLDIDNVAKESGLSRSNAGSHMSNLKKKVEFDSRTLDNNKKEYRLPEEQKEKILGSR